MTATHPKMKSSTTTLFTKSSTVSLVCTAALSCSGQTRRAPPRPFSSRSVQAQRSSFRCISTKGAIIQPQLFPIPCAFFGIAFVGGIEFFWEGLRLVLPVVAVFVAASGCIFPPCFELQVQGPVGCSNACQCIVCARAALSESTKEMGAATSTTPMIDVLDVAVLLNQIPGSIAECYVSCQIRICSLMLWRAQRVLGEYIDAKLPAECRPSTCLGS